ncbi:hypothetical protein ACN20G_34265 (plasmid) [Streptomyces sp. BI20]|uniref:hypothetical protein n=1 Tax=Streptomyces sp. BI20 TaxID=3403460 RepID=UPI003C7291C7
MEPLLLSLHIVAGILFVGPVAVATSLFPRYAPLAAPPPPGADPGVDPGGRGPDTARLLHRITHRYGVLAVTVPVAGLVLALVQGRAGDVWVVVAMVLTAVAGALLVLRIAPAQREALDSPDDGARLRRLGAMTGVFNLLWAAVVVLMVSRPGSSPS